MGKLWSLLLFIVLIRLSSGYIDPGTGGYLVTSIWPTIVMFLTVFFAGGASFVYRKLVVPSKKLCRKYKRILVSLIVGITCFIFLLMFLPINIANPFDEKVFYDIADLDEGVPRAVRENVSGPYYLKDPFYLFYPIEELRQGMFVYDSERTYPGYILTDGVILNSSGNVIHSWGENHTVGVIQDDGTYVAVKRDKGTLNSLVKYSWDGQIIWKNDVLGPHHKIFITKNNTILTMSKEVHEYLGEVVEFDTIIELNQDGELLKSWSTWENLEYIQSFHERLDVINKISRRGTPSPWGGVYDYYHMNSVREIGPNINSDFEVRVRGEVVRPFSEGNLLFSFRHGSMIFILDRDSMEVVWSITQFDVDEQLQAQHDPQMLSNGNILIYDNGYYRRWSRIIELNPITIDIEWEYRNEDFFSSKMGNVQKLPNGNVLISESFTGRLFEITSEGEILWEFFNHKIVKYSEESVKNQVIEMVAKYDVEFIDSFINA